MAYYVFLKSLRSLEEFRKNPHVKIPPKSPYTNFQSLDKFKNPIFNSEILSLDFGPTNLRPTRLVSPASPLAAPSPAGRKRPTGPSSPRVGRVITGNTFSFSDHAFPSNPPSPSVTVTRVPPVENFPAPPLPYAAAPRLGCP
jgi:hypothetical protein